MTKSRCSNKLRGTTSSVCCFLSCSRNVSCNPGGHSNSISDCGATVGAGEIEVSNHILSFFLLYASTKSDESSLLCGCDFRANRHKIAKMVKTVHVVPNRKPNTNMKGRRNGCMSAYS